MSIYNIGKLWNFVILEKINDGKYKYHESESYNCLKITELKQIYINLQALNFLFKTEFFNVNEENFSKKCQNFNIKKKQC